jgi:hypothetical protein
MHAKTGLCCRRSTRHLYFVMISRYMRRRTCAVVAVVGTCTMNINAKTDQGRRRSKCEDGAALLRMRRQTCAVVAAICTSCEDGLLPSSQSSTPVFPHDICHTHRKARGPRTLVPSADYTRLPRGSIHASWRSS